MSPSVAPAATSAAVSATIGAADIDIGRATRITATPAIGTAARVGGAEKQKSDKTGNCGQYDESDHRIAHAISSPATGQRSCTEKVS